MKMILILLFISGFWLGILNLKNKKHLKNDKSRINANKVASQKMVEFLDVRRWEKRNMYTVWKDYDILTHKNLIKFKNILKHFSSKCILERISVLATIQNFQFFFMNNVYIHIYIYIYIYIYIHTYIHIYT